MKCAPVADKLDWWQLDWNDFEAQVLAGSFQRMAVHYQLQLEDLPPALQKHWRGHVAEAKDADALKEEQHLLEGERQAWRSERLTLAEKWLAAYMESGVGRPWSLQLEREELEGLLMVLNDRRLILALEHGIDETLMEVDFDDIKEVPLRQALWEVHVLALFQEQCLAALTLASNPETKKDDTL